MIPEVRAVELLNRYEAVLIDAYGVLVTSSGPIEGAASFLSAVAEGGKQWAIVTNDASRSPQTAAAAYAARGIAVNAERIVTSGGLLTGWFAENDLVGAKAVVLGTPDSARYVVEAGGEVVHWREEPEVVVLGDESGFEFLPAFDEVLSHVVRRTRRGDPVALVVPNPDVVYPRGDGAFGVASGGIAAMFERSFEALLGDEAPRFERLGKPSARIFEEAVRRVGTRDCVMIGDQLATDIRGANEFGIDSALVETGVDSGNSIAEVVPTWRITRLI